MQSLRGWHEADPGGRGEDHHDTIASPPLPLFITAPQGNATGSRPSRPISITTNQPAPSGRSLHSSSLFTPISGGLGATPRSAAHPYYTMSAPLRPAGGPHKTPELASSSSQEGLALHYPSGSPTNGLKQSPRRKKAPAFPRSVRGSSEHESIDYCQTPSVLRVPASPRNPANIMYSGTPNTPSYSLPFGMPTSNIRGGGPDPGEGSGRQRRASSSTSRATAKLDGIPHTYVVKSLRKLAPQFWNKAETADCRIRTCCHPRLSHSLLTADIPQWCHCVRKGRRRLLQPHL